MTLKNAALLALVGDDFDNGSLGVDVRLQCRQRPAWLGSCRDAVLVVHLCVWLFSAAVFFYVFHRRQS